MDHDRFDRLARRVFADGRRSRRAALTAILGAALAPAHVAVVSGKGQKKRKVKVAAQAVDRCYPGTSCAPGKGKNTSRCDFSFSTVFQNKDVRGANLSKSNFVGATLTGADFRGANLSEACLISADLSGATLGGSVNLGGAVFCNTTMPDGSIDDSGCEGSTPCCHLRAQNCPDETFTCWTLDRDGICNRTAGSLTVGTCWNFPLCCPCQHHQDQAFWNEQCQLTFPQGCAGHCQAEFEGANGCHEGFICP
jgi:uncharacterized protein YjbI with pentapeptide repeats